MKTVPDTLGTIENESESANMKREPMPSVLSGSEKHENDAVGTAENTSGRTEHEQTWYFMDTEPVCIDL
jgi:hypothetical protein